MARRGIIAGSVGVTVLAAAALRGVLRRFEIREDSMAPALESGDWIVAKRRTGILERGDIVVLADPAGTGMNLVKRVIGVPGEHIGIENGRVTVNSAVLADRWANGVTGPDGDWELSAGHIWVLGDNRVHSRSDGRLFGPIPIESVQWQVVALYWPMSRARTIA
jgi:signal peptidase I